MKKGVTLAELMIVVALVGILFLALSPYMYTLRRTWHLADGRSDILQNGRIAMDKMVRELRQATGFGSVTASTDPAGHIVYSNKDGATKEFLLYNDGSSNMLGYVQSSVTSPLAGPIDSLYFTCYGADGLTTTTEVNDIKSIVIDLSVADPRGEIASQTLTSRAFVRIEELAGVTTIVINEIMYNPLDSIPGNEERFYEYIELYNVSAASIDVAGWRFSDDGINFDTIVGDATHGTGTTIIPAGGYALLTDQDTKVYDVGSPYTVPAGAIKLQVDDNNIGNGLQDNNDTVSIYDDTGALVDQVDYSDTWGAGGSDGNGDSLERIDPNGGSNDPSNWEDSVLNGTPGSAN